ncbi:MAG: carbamoyl phosphate synthase large subunit, partial [Eggerthellaceae bacterium]|nr:carbamoyl phosphate synthase large subunit [Eggerthellaceae bacterium]
MPEAGMAVDVGEALEIAHQKGYPVMVRPSYVQGGRGIEVVYDDENLRAYMAAAVGVTPDRPILIDRFLNHALECEADAICDGTLAYVPAVMEHVELAGVHSGDSAAILPSFTISDAHLATIKEYTRLIAEAMHVRGLMNIQYAIEGDTVYVLEANPRASRTVPLVSKVCGIQMVQVATDVITLPLTGRTSPVAGLGEVSYAHYGVKEAVFPFNMFPEVDPVLGPEMRSTGEVLGLADTFGEAFYKSQEATQTPLPLSGTVIISVSDMDKCDLVEMGKLFVEAGFEIVATKGTRDYLVNAGVPATLTLKSSEGRPNLIDLMTNGEVDLVVNTPSTTTKSANDGSLLRHTAIKAHIPYMTTVAAGKAAALGILEMQKHDGKASPIRSLQEIHSSIVR